MKLKHVLESLVNQERVAQLKLHQELVHYAPDSIEIMPNADGGYDVTAKDGKKFLLRMDKTYEATYPQPLNSWNGYYELSQNGVKFHSQSPFAGIDQVVAYNGKHQLMEIAKKLGFIVHKPLKIDDDPNVVSWIGDDARASPCAPEFGASIDLKAGSRVAYGREAYSIQVRHPLFKQPTTISVLADGPRGPEVRVGSHIQFDLSHPRGIETLIGSVNEKLDAIKIEQWLLEHEFELTDKTEFESKKRIALRTAGFRKNSKLYVRYVATDIVVVKVGFTSYQSVDYEYWLIDKYFTGITREGRQLYSFKDVQVLVGSIISK